MFFIISRLIADYRRALAGATAIEYGLIGGGVALAIMLALFAFGDSLLALYQSAEPKVGEIAARAENGG